MRIIGIIYILFNLFHTGLYAAENLPEIKPFHTDYCTGYPEGTREEPMLWANCCIKHDLAYYVSGTRKDRRKADKLLRSCVEKVSTKTRANIMYTGIVLGHLSPIKAKTAWGWAWKNFERKSFDELSDEQKQEALHAIYQSDVELYLIDEFLKEFF